jgi:hypothetical protein
VEQVIEKAKDIEFAKFSYALIKEEDILNSVRFNSIESLMQYPPSGNGRYVIVAIGQSLEIKTQIILD